MPPQPPRKDDPQEADFTRKMVLGILSTLETKGLLSSGEVESIIRAARQASAPAPAPRRAGPAAPGTRWATPDGQPLGMDRSTPIAIPDVKRQSTPALDPAAGKETVPVIDMTME
ncbi:hypothetical protein HNQ07_000530 [Deinococcus metalli]|uniref:Uncharacterized protein n=1 Tax=Deinococcus metalli TaxID=1141878 RepID=A0A7W8KBJ3_9DEIO|nr:hypothetical protein [Deinococcus metalli]MBB5375086.1 hypothetical protein [Deinococcus metalli]GHF31630.1 hypothetical protein GCM10017781_05120 [Deinococcus metalli]